MIDNYKSKQKFLLAAALLLACWLAGGAFSALKAQDPVFSQEFSNSLYTNPALAGSKEALRVSFDNRLQWITAISKITNNSFSADMAFFDRLGVGISGVYSNQGQIFNLTGVGAAFSYRFGDLRKIVVQPGIEFGYQHRNLNWSDLVFYDQLNPFNNNVAPYSEAAQIYENVSLFDVNAGMAMQVPVNLFRTQPAWLNAGFAVHHIPENDLSHVGLQETLYPRRYTFHAGLLLPIYRRDSARLHHRTVFTLYPNFKYTQQEKFNRLDLGVLAYRKPFVAGISLRTFKEFYNFDHANHISALIGYEGQFGKFTAYQLSYSIDWAYTGVTGSDVSAFLTHEFSLVFLFSPRRQSDCIEALDYTGRWFDSEKSQRRFKGECPPGKPPRKRHQDLKPVFYPFELPVY